MTGELFEASLPELAKQARLKANRLIRLGAFQPDEREDLEQDLLLQLWRKRERIDSADKACSAYLAVIMRNKGQDLVRYQNAPIRDRRRRGSLPGDLDAEGRRARPPSLTSRPAFDEQIDVRRAVGLLPAPKQHFASMLGEYGILEAARQMRISRSTAWRWKVEIRELLLRYGVGPAGAR